MAITSLAVDVLDVHATEISDPLAATEPTPLLQTTEDTSNRQRGEPALEDICPGCGAPDASYCTCKRPETPPMDHFGATEAVLPWLQSG